MGRPANQVPEGSKWCSYHQMAHDLSAFNGSKNHSCSEGQTLYYVRRVYGLTEEQYLQMKSGPCDICGTKEGKYVDHCHDTNVVRGWLCPGCNTAIGQFNDDIDLLKKALAYLEKALARQ